MTTDSVFTAEPSSFSTAVFHSLSLDEERHVLALLQQRRQDPASATDPAPVHHELFSVTTRLIAPTVGVFGTPTQQDRFLSAFERAETLCCQLFSEPSAGSDLAGLATRAERDGDEWVVNGQKVWSSGALLADWGLLIARTNPDVAKHAGMTAFLVPMDSPGIEIRPIRQMNGGASFNEVFMTDLRVSDALRLGDVGQGWSVALTTLGFERDHTDSGNEVQPGGTWEQVLVTASALGRGADPTIRQALADLFVRVRVEELTNQRVAALGTGAGPEGSIGKLLWTERMRRMSDVVSLVVGPALVADTGQFATYAWGEHVLGAPGYRIAGGADEIQRNIIGEQVLGLPPEPRVDKGMPWREVPR